MGKLNAKKVAVLATNGFEQSEFEKPIAALKDAGAQVDVISLKSGKITSWKDKNWGDEFAVDKTVNEVSASEYDALVLPGGVMNPDQLRQDEDAVKFVSDFLASGKPIGAICHGPWTLIETGNITGRMMTSYPSLKTDLTNAGVNWVDRAVVVDNGLVTSRTPEDLPAFCKKIIEEISEGVHA